MKVSQASRIIAHIELIEETARAPFANRLRKLSSSMTRTNASASAVTSPGATNNPDTSGSITPRCAPTGVVITVSPWERPSSTDIAIPSALDGRTRTSASAHKALTPASLSQPGKRSLSRMPSLSANLRKSSIGPPPASVAYQRRELTDALARALRNSGTPFLSLRCPRKSKWQGLSAQRTLSRSGVDLGQRYEERLCGPCAIGTIER